MFHLAARSRRRRRNERAQTSGQHAQCAAFSIGWFLLSAVAICVGASLGALLRWWLGAQLHSLFPTIPPGTLLANLIGGYIIGIAIGVFAALPPLSP